MGHRSDCYLNAPLSEWKDMDKMYTTIRSALNLHQFLCEHEEYLHKKRSLSHSVDSVSRSPRHNSLDSTSSSLSPLSKNDTADVFVEKEVTE